MELKTGGVHHMALVCKDMAATHEFYTKVMKMRLTAAITVPPMPEDEALHLFYDMGGGNQLAFFWFKHAPETVISQARPENVASVSAHGSMHHVAFTAGSEDEVLAWRERIKANGLPVTPMIDHGFCKSIYFQDPSGIQLEISYWVRVLNETDIEADVLRRAGITLEKEEPVTV
jgi:catechol 2,3-dioxygenase-like lactoylglutathione lyase family enzyme